MNKKGFTLVELLAVIALLAILMAIAVPNVISTINNNKRNTFLTDAGRMIAKAEYLVASSKTDRNALKTGPVIYTMSQLNEKQEFQTDADGGGYHSSSYVKVSLNSTTNTYEYCICVVGSRRKISKTNTATCNSTTAPETECLKRSELTGISVVKDK